MNVDALSDTRKFAQKIGRAMHRRQILIGGAALAAVGAGGAYVSVQTMGSTAKYDSSVAATRAALKKSPEMLGFVRYATLAANSHNTQPWLFRVSDGGIDILADKTRRIAIVDPDDHHLFVSLGCAAENLAIAYGAHGKAGELSFSADSDGAVRFAFGRGPPAEEALFDAIPKRQSTRCDYDGRPVSATALHALFAAAAVPGVDLVLITDRPQIDRVRDLVVTGNSAQIADPAFVRELKTWVRFNWRQAIQHGDGLFSATTGNPVVPSWLGSMMFDLVFTAEAENEKYARQLASTPGIAVFVAKQDDREHWVLAGRACQRFALQATALGLKHAFINQPVEVANLRPEMAALIGHAGRRPDIVMRFGYGPAMPYSARRPAESLITT